MILKKYKINFFVISILIFYLLLLIKINFLFAYNKIVYNFNYPINASTKKNQLDLPSFHQKKTHIEGIQYGYGSNIFKIFQFTTSINAEKNVVKLEFIALYKKSYFFKKNLIVQNELLKDFDFSFEVKKLNLNFLVIYIIKTLLIIFMFFILFKWIFYFSNKLK
jgi:hypothetical protein